MWRSCRVQPSHKERAIGVVRYKKEGMLLRPLRWCCVDYVVHHEWDVREEQKYICVARASNNEMATHDVYCCLLPRCEALCTCRSGFPIATALCQVHVQLCFRTVARKSSKGGVAFVQGDWHSENDKTPPISSVSYLNLWGLHLCLGGMSPPKSPHGIGTTFSADWVHFMCNFGALWWNSDWNVLGWNVWKFPSGVDVFFKLLHIGKFLLEASWPLASCTARVWRHLKYFAVSYVWLS